MAKLLRVEVEQSANIQEGERPPAVVCGHPGVGVAIEFALDRCRSITKLSQVAPRLRQDASGQFLFGLRDSEILGGVHIVDRLVSLVFKKPRTPHFRESQIFCPRRDKGCQNRETHLIWQSASKTKKPPRR